MSDPNPNSDSPAKTPIDPGASETNTDSSAPTRDDGPGWLPAIMAATVLMGIAGFVFCAVSTWVLFQRRTELATRTIRDAYLPELEQSQLDPATKKDVVTEVKRLAADLENGKYENWQSAGILQRLQRVPMLQWGRLTAVRTAYEDSDVAQPESLAAIDKDLSRLQHGIEKDRFTSFDLQDVLEPVLVADPKSPSAYSLIRPITSTAAESVFERLSLLVDGAEIEDQSFETKPPVEWIRRAIAEGTEEGTM